jgi:hypothetical protein
MKITNDLKSIFTFFFLNISMGGRRGHVRMVIGFTITYVISAYHH